MKNSELKVGTMLSYVYLIIYNLAQIIYTPILLNGLGENMYGVYSLCISIVNYFTLLDFGLGNAVIRFSSIYKDKQEDKRNEVYGFFFFIYSIFALVALVIGIVVSINSSSFFSSDFSQNDIAFAKTVIIILTLNVAISLPLSVFSSIVTAYQKFIFLKVLNIVKTCMSTIVMIILLLLGYKAIALSIVTLIVNLVYLICITLYAIKKLNVRLSFKLRDKKIIKEIFSFSIFAFVLLVIDKINMSVDMLILGKISTPYQLTIYTIASKVFQIYIALGGVISGMLLPKFTKLVEEENDSELNNQFLEKSKWQFTIVIYICFGFLIFGETFLNLWLGGEYHVSYVIANLLMFSSAIPLSLNVANVILQAKNQQKFRAIVLVLVLILNVILSIILGMKYGAIGCTMGTVFTYIVGHVFIMMVYLKKKQNLNMVAYIKNILQTICIHFPVAFLITIMINFIDKMLFDFLGLILYIVIVSILEYKLIATNKEKEIIKRILAKFWRKKNGVNI